MKHETRQLAVRAKDKEPSGCGTRHGYIGGVCLYCGKTKRKRKAALRDIKEKQV